jgi:acyl phosphate:glycerol-3-phosphate acyltransferase
MEALIAVGYLIGACLIGSIPFSYLMARIASGTDLRRVGSGTVSGTGVGASSGFWPMALAGLLDIGKGAAAVIPMAVDHPLLAAVGAGAAAAGHNWSVFLGGEGGRAISVALGATLVLAWPGTVVLALGMAVGRLFRQTGLGSFVAQAALPGVLAITDGAVGAVLGGAVVVPMWLKRLLGNGRPQREQPRVYLSRLVLDNDEGWKPSASPAD